MSFLWEVDSKALPIRAVNEVGIYPSHQLISTRYGLPFIWLNHSEFKHSILSFYQKLSAEVVIFIIRENSCKS